MFALTFSRIMSLFLAISCSIYSSVLLVASTLAVEAESPGAETPPNIIFIFTDDQGWGDMGVYGHPEMKTPNLDKLASEGMLFTEGYASSPVCSPSRVAALTGLYPARTGMHHALLAPATNERRGVPQRGLDPSCVTYADILKTAGYATGHFGKWHVAKAPGSEFGFDEYLFTHNYPEPDETMHEWRRHSTEDITNDSIDFIERHASQPFLLNVWYKNPHAILDPTGEMMAEYPNRPPWVGEKWPGAEVIYYSIMTYVDQQAGRLLTRLDELGLASNTIVVFSSDNGPEDIHVNNAEHSGVGSPGPFRGLKRSIYEGGVRVPFLVRYPGYTPAGSVNSEDVVGMIDLLPTFVSLAGLDMPADLVVDGIDLSRVLQGRSDPAVTNRRLFWEWRYRIIGHPINAAPTHAVRQGDWKLLKNWDDSRVELYNLRTDPMEVNNVSQQFPGKVTELSQAIDQWRETIPPWANAEEPGDNSYPWPKEPAEGEILNPSFEEVSGDNPAHWTILSNNVRVYAGVDNPKASDGNKALQFTGDSPDQPGQVAQWLSLEHGKTYQLAFDYVAANDAGPTEITVSVENRDGRIIAERKVTVLQPLEQGHETAELVFDAPAQQVKLSLKETSFNTASRAPIIDNLRLSVIAD